VEPLCSAPQMRFDFPCKHCSQQFSSSLREIVRGGGRLTCPKCDRTYEYSMADILEPANEELPSTKKTAA
jgi:transcription elongation factor Elf1